MGELLPQSDELGFSGEEPLMIVRAIEALSLAMGFMLLLGRPG